MVARNLLDTMRQVGDNAEEATAILQSMVRLSEDPGLYFMHGAVGGGADMTPLLIQNGVGPVYR